jgi:choline dehydrogenase
MPDLAETADVVVVGGGSGGAVLAARLSQDPARTVRSLSPTGGAIVLQAALTQPESRGTLKLASRDPGDAPLIDANYLATGRDARRMLEGVKLGRAIARNPVFAPFTAAELAPGDAVTDDDALAQVIDANIAIYGHPTSTVPMGGPGDPWAVVDSVGAVKGLSGLRVADASIIPDVPSSTTNVTVIMLAEHVYQRVYAGLLRRHVTRSGVMTCRPRSAMLTVRQPAIC